MLGMREMLGFLERWMLVICGGECTGRRHPGSGNGGMPYGFWSKAGLRWRWPRRWDGMPIPLAGGLPSSARAVRGRWPSSSRVVPPRDRQSAADRTEGSGAGGSSKGWPQLGQLELEGGAQICAGTFRGLPEPQQLPELPPSTRGQALHRLGFVLKWPKKRLLKADAAKRETFVAEYAALVDEAQQVGAKVFFVDEAHLRADADPVSGYGAGSEGQMGAQG